VSALSYVAAESITCLVDTFRRGLSFSPVTAAVINTAPLCPRRAAAGVSPPRSRELRQPGWGSRRTRHPGDLCQDTLILGISAHETRAECYRTFGEEGAGSGSMVLVLVSRKMRDPSSRAMA